MCDGFFVEEAGDLVHRVYGAGQLHSSQGAVPDRVGRVDVGEWDAAVQPPDVGGDENDDGDDEVHGGRLWRDVDVDVQMRRGSSSNLSEVFNNFLSPSICSILVNEVGSGGSEGSLQAVCLRSAIKMGKISLIRCID